MTEPSSTPPERDTPVDEWADEPSIRQGIPLELRLQLQPLTHRVRQHSERITRHGRWLPELEDRIDTLERERLELRGALRFFKWTVGVAAVLGTSILAATAWVVITVVRLDAAAPEWTASRSEVQTLMVKIERLDGRIEELTKRLDRADRHQAP